MSAHNSPPVFYLAGTGLVSPIGASATMTYATFKAGISAYELSDYSSVDDAPIKMASVPQGMIDAIPVELDEGDRFNLRHDRMTKMAIYAINDACDSCPQQSIPLVLGLPNSASDSQGLASLLQNLQHNCQPWVDSRLSRCLHSGRAAGMEALAFATNYLYQQAFDYVLVGGVDSFQDDEILQPLAQESRLLTANSGDGFAPGEAACFLLLTKHKALAQARNGYVIALHPPTLAQEPGHLYSDQPYLGSGLDQAFKGALTAQPEQSIQAIYSSMNGENYWAKEYGVAHIRNKDFFTEKIRLEHPADCYGDLGAATATALICMAAEDLHKHQQQQRHLVYSSADNAVRAAMVLEKIPA